MKKYFALVLVAVLSVVSVSAFAEGEKKISAESCAKVKENLVNLQHTDSRARVYLGRYYETILNKFIVPLNMRLVENNIAEPTLVENQGQFKEVRQGFIDDYITYQKDLESLVGINCEENTSEFYSKLKDTRAKRQTVAQDITRLRSLMKKHTETATKLLEKMNEK
jgi:hypothetical protein